MDTKFHSYSPAQKTIFRSLLNNPAGKIKYFNAQLRSYAGSRPIKSVLHSLVC